jgi:hypothetical protein
MYLDSRLYDESMTKDKYIFFNKGVGLDKGIDTTDIIAEVLISKY